MEIQPDQHMFSHQLTKMENFEKGMYANPLVPTKTPSKINIAPVIITRPEENIVARKND
jgi:hypothetical protein